MFFNNVPIVSTLFCDSNWEINGKPGNTGQEHKIELNPYADLLPDANALVQFIPLLAKLFKLGVTFKFFVFIKPQ